MRVEFLEWIHSAYLAALNGLAVAMEHLGSLDKVTRIVRLGVSVNTLGDVRDQPKVADGASELLQDVLGKDKNPSHSWRRKPSAQRPRRSGNHLRGGGVNVRRAMFARLVSSSKCF
jgi:hypothetical protein